MAAGGIAILALVIPAVAAYKSGVFNDTQIRATAYATWCVPPGESKNEPALDEMQCVDEPPLRAQDCRTQDRSVHSNVQCLRTQWSGLSPAERELLQFCNAQQDAAISMVLKELHFAPFFPGLATMAWPFVLLFLFLLAWPPANTKEIDGNKSGQTPRPHDGGRAPSNAKEIDGGKWAILSTAILLALISTNLARELAPLMLDGRRVISSTASDLSIVGTWVQGLMLAASAVLFGRIWAIWLKRFDISMLRKESDSEWPQIMDSIVDEGVACSHEMDNWTKTLLLLACACAPMSFVYWRVVAVYHDERYIPAAIVFHGLWAITATLVTRPLLNDLRRHARLRLQLLSVHLRKGKDSPNVEDADAVTKMIRRFAPISSFALLLSVLTSIASLLAPLVELARK